MLIRFNSEDDVILIVNQLKEHLYTNVTYWPPTHYQEYFSIFFKHPKLSHEFVLYVKRYYDSGDMLKFPTTKDGIEFDISIINNYVQKKLDKKLAKQLNKNVAAVNKPIFSMYVSGKILELGGTASVNEHVVHGKFDVYPGIVKIIVNTSTKRNPDLDFDERKIQVVSKAFRLNFYTTVGNFFKNFPNFETMKEPTHERTTNA